MSDRDWRILEAMRQFVTAADYVSRCRGDVGTAEEQLAARKEDLIAAEKKMEKAAAKLKEEQSQSAKEGERQPKEEERAE